MWNQEAYYDMLVKYRDELSRPIQEAMDFMRRIETQLNILSNGAVRVFSSGTLSGHVCLLFPFIFFFLRVICSIFFINRPISVPRKDIYLHIQCEQQITDSYKPPWFNFVCKYCWPKVYSGYRSLEALSTLPCVTSRFQ